MYGIYMRHAVFVAAFDILDGVQIAKFVESNGDDRR